MAIRAGLGPALCGVGSSCHRLPDTAPWALKSTCQAAVSLQGSTEPAPPPHSWLCPFPGASSHGVPSSRTLPTAPETWSNFCCLSGGVEGLGFLTVSKPSCPPRSGVLAFCLPRGPCRQVQLRKPRADQHLLIRRNPHTMLDSFLTSNAFALFTVLSVTGLLLSLLQPYNESEGRGHTHGWYT